MFQGTPLATLLACVVRLVTVNIGRHSVPSYGGSPDTAGRRYAFSHARGYLATRSAALRARRETNESSASEERRNRIANALGATRARKAILGG